MRSGLYLESLLETVLAKHSPSVPGGLGKKKGWLGRRGLGSPKTQGCPTSGPLDPILSRRSHPSNVSSCHHQGPLPCLEK